MYKIPAANDTYQLSFSRLPRQKAPNPLNVMIKSSSVFESTSPPRNGNGRKINLRSQSVS